MGLMTSRTSSYFMTLLLLMPISITLSHATSFVPIPLTTQVGEADTVVRGKIGTSYSDYGSRNDGGRGIYTFYHLQVTEVLKGDVPDTSSILIREMGGEVNGVGMQVAGSAHFDPGEDAVVFMGAKNPDGSYEMKGLASGKYNIQTQPDGTENLLGLAQHETMASLRAVAQQQRGKSAHIIAPSPSPSFTAPSSAMGSSHSAASQLQPSSTPASDEEGKPSAKISIWVFILAAGLLGWFVLRKLTKR
jgi:hypothetical protein